jgi:glycosyltransferase involved in cell wall biosynthesis
VTGLRVALYHDFAEESLFGVRFYAERLQSALRGRCELLDVYPRPRSVAWRMPLAVWFVKAILYPAQVRGLSADVHHVLDQSHADLLGALPADRSVITCHDLHPLSPVAQTRWPRRVLYRRRVAKLRRAARVVAVSEFAARSVRERLGIAPERVVVVRNPLDRFFLEEPAAAETAAARARCRLSPRGFVLHVGAAWPYKNLETAIRALGVLARQRPEAPPLVKVGAALTPAQRSLAAAERVGVVELGERDRTELRAIYRDAALLLYPSWEEGWGWPVAEAMAAGTPVVASGSGALREVASGAALEIDPADAEGIAAAVARVLDDSALARDLGERGRARARELASGDFGAEMAAVYASLAGARS